MGSPVYVGQIRGRRRTGEDVAAARTVRRIATSAVLTRMMISRVTACALWQEREAPEVRGPASRLEQWRKSVRWRLRIEAVRAQSRWVSAELPPDRRPVWSSEF